MYNHHFYLYINMYISPILLSGQFQNSRNCRTKKWQH